MSKKQGELRCYECSLDKKHWVKFNATSQGQAKMDFYHYLDGDFDYLLIKCRVVGNVHTSEAFIRNAIYRKIEFAYCGMVVEMDGNKGVITGHNDSANLNVLFTEGKYKGQLHNCHPNWKMTYFNSKGEVIKSFDENRNLNSQTT